MMKTFPESIKLKESKKENCVMAKFTNTPYWVNMKIIALGEREVFLQHIPPFQHNNNIYKVLNVLGQWLSYEVIKENDRVIVDF